MFGPAQRRAHRAMGGVFCSGRDKPEDDFSGDRIIQAEEVLLAEGDEKLVNLMKRFPSCKEQEVRDALASAKGHAGVAAASLKRQTSTSEDSPAMAASEPEPEAEGFNEDNDIAEPAEAEEDDKVTNLMKRFPEHDEATVRQVLKRAGGHAGLAMQNLKKLTTGTSEPSSSRPSSPTQASRRTTGPEPATPPSPEEQPHSADSQVANLMIRFPDAGEGSVRLALKRANGHAGRAVAILKNKEVDPAATSARSKTSGRGAGVE